MARVKFSIKTKSDPANIYIRFYHSRDFDLNCKTGFLINPKYWSNKQQRVKTTSANAFDQIINPKLNDLKETIVTQYNITYNSGKKIDKTWLQSVVSHFNKQPLREEDNPKYYFIPFFQNFIEESKNKINPKTNKKIDSKTISKYQTTLERVADFEKFTNTRLRLIDINLNFHKAFLNYLVTQWMYNGTTNEKYIHIIKGVCKDAKSKDLDVSKDIESKYFTVRREKTYDTYLSETEIDRIFNLEISDKSLDHVRNWIIIGVWTGLRVSDLKRLSSVNLKKETIEITTLKTGDDAIIPIHPQVKKVLIKYNNTFPPPLSEQHFNEKMKDVGELAKINQVIRGKIPHQVTLPNGEEVFRKKIGNYKKFKLLSSHTCRRSFATNHYGKLPNRTIMAITTHKSEAQFEKYLKQSQLEHVEALKKFWNK